MTDKGTGLVAAVLREQQAELLKDWMAAQPQAGPARRGAAEVTELREHSRRILALLPDALRDGPGVDLDHPGWTEIRAMLEEFSRARVEHGYSPTETATYIFSLKEPLFARLRERLRDDPALLGDAIWQTSVVLDRLGLFTVEAFQRSREEVIRRQQEDLLELSTPVVRLWDGVLALPLIGTLDSARTQVVMENLLQTIVQSQASIAIIDITGVPTVDTLVAQHLIRTVSAARLMGADCIISGIRPQIAQTIVHLGVRLGDVSTKATLADAFKLALQRTGLTVAAAGRATG